eukprot:CAMPEP_0116847950 /NCGR_PEP_ID=MMETSP0418-20121206/14715_1 /TAXON_ID=1158023 /ORGANISM="Astrosyne radiata, Strain 13vi08-1A" /LENGTH=166 /DNA_ID=CAMNT_0004479445 /DNA_START=64 /DNA_END=564 /DNA_ORIENTATION=+
MSTVMRRAEIECTRDIPSNRLMNTLKYQVQMKGFYVSVVLTLRDADVLCGRGRTCFNHIGNKRFRTIISSNVQRYVTAKSKSDKTALVEEIIYEVWKENGRFLKEDPETGLWLDTGLQGAKEKVGHSLRDAATMTKTKFRTPRRKSKNTNNSTPTASLGAAEQARS